MSNEFCMDSKAGEALVINNRFTEDFILVLALAASALAKSGREKQWASWFASKSQVFFAPGCVGFDLSEMPWSGAEDFDAEKAFVLAVIEAAKAGTNWDRAGYDINPGVAVRCLDEFEHHIRAYELAEPPAAGFGEEFGTVEHCANHRLYKYAGHCLICLANRERIDAVTDSTIARLEQALGRKMREPGR